MIPLRLATIGKTFRNDLQTLKAGEDINPENILIRDCSSVRGLWILKEHVVEVVDTKVYFHKVEISMTKEDILSYTCTCQSGNVLCQHMAALLLCAYEQKDIMSEAVKQESNSDWCMFECTQNEERKNPSNIGDTDDISNIRTIDQNYPSDKNYTAIDRPVNDEYRIFLKKELEKAKIFNRIWWLLSCDPNL